MITKLLLVLMSLAIAGCGETKTAMERPLEPMAEAPPDDAGWELVRHATYSASQTPGEVIIRATGDNPTSGYETRLTQSPARIWPPQYRLMRKPPDGIVTQVVTPFEVSTSFKASEVVREVTVFDAAGAHRVVVDQARD